MRLTELEPEWMVLGSEPMTTSRRGGEDLDVTSAQGLAFLCPRCFAKNGGPVGTHSILAWFRGRGVPDQRRPGPGRWAVSGTGFDDLTLSPSIDISTPEQPDEWHGFITNGEVR